MFCFYFWSYALYVMVFVVWCSLLFFLFFLLKVKLRKLMLTKTTWERCGVAWGLSLVTGHAAVVERSNELNPFFNRFDTVPQITLLTSLCQLSNNDQPLYPPSVITWELLVPYLHRPPKWWPSPLSRWEDSCRNSNGLSPKVLKACAPQLSGALHHVFNFGLSLQRVPRHVEDSIPLTCSKDAVS